MDAQDDDEHVTKSVGRGRGRGSAVPLLPAGLWDEIYKEKEKPDESAVDSFAETAGQFEDADMNSQLLSGFGRQVMNLFLLFIPQTCSYISLLPGRSVFKRRVWERRTEWSWGSRQWPRRQRV